MLTGPTDNTIATAFHTVLLQLEQGACAYLVFVDYSSAFYTIVPSRLVSKLSDLRFRHNNRFRPLDKGLSAVSQDVPPPLPHLVAQHMGCISVFSALSSTPCTPTHNTNTIITFVDTQQWWG